MKTFQELFGTDKNLEAGQGLDLIYPVGTITIHRAGGANKNYSKTLQQKMSPYRMMIENGIELEENLSRKLLAETYVEAVIVRWTDAEDKEVPRDTWVQTLIDLPDLFSHIMASAQKSANFRAATLETDAKNSPAS